MEKEEKKNMKNLDLRQFSEVMVALLAQKGISCRLGENNGRIGIIYEEAGIKASTDVTLLWQKYGADYDVTELADVLYKAITSEVQKKKAEMPNPKPEQQVQPQISRPQMRTQPGRVTQQPMPDDMGGKMQIKCFNGIPGQNCAPCLTWQNIQKPNRIWPLPFTSTTTALPSKLILEGLQ